MYIRYKDNHFPLTILIYFYLDIINVINHYIYNTRRKEKQKTEEKIATYNANRSAKRKNQLSNYLQQFKQLIIHIF